MDANFDADKEAMVRLAIENAAKYHPVLTESDLQSIEQTRLQLLTIRENLMKLNNHLEDEFTKGLDTFGTKTLTKLRDKINAILLCRGE